MSFLIPDINVLLYAIDNQSPQHAKCRQWLVSAFESETPVGWSWQVLLGFVRLSTKASLFKNPLSVENALDVVDDWLSRPASVVIYPTERHSQILRRLLLAVGVAGNLTTDAHLAALALSHEATLVSCDRDFGRFESLRWLNPLE